MTVFTNLKYKNVNIKDPSITIILPKYIEVTKEVFVHSLISLGKILTSKTKSKTYFLVIAVAEVGGYLGMILGINLLHLKNIFGKLKPPPDAKEKEKHLIELKMCENDFVWIDSVLDVKIKPIIIIIIIIHPEICN